MAETPVQAIPSDTDIADAARAALQDRAQTIYLSRLGQDLRQVYGASFKAALGTRSLGDFVVEHLGDTYEVWGKGPYKRVGVIGSAAADDAPPPLDKYPDTLWRAFGTPLPEGCRRWVSLGPPLSVEDAWDAPQQAAIEITADFVVEEDGRSRRERAAAIGASIRRWASQAGLPMTSLVEQAAAVPRAQPPSGRPDGPEALRQLIAAIPEEERARYSLPMNLVGRLLQVP
ncbi:hypothetical protein [Sphingomonas sp. GM_Shp_1]|uniref:hypothetical protein n=1 Tax=Sphingomonas sp. GM_Shp_1 TaxID=2937381 RepID=UPI00226B2E9F|nr:hypothetical protein [Sphingomonas sp. GM_Shp_1]